jgi:hypothetical protein
VNLRGLALLVLLIPGATYVWIAVHWQRQGLSPQTGDEPHYLVIADAIKVDHSLDVRKAYARDAITRRAYGPVDWENHTRTTSRGVFSLHSPGLSAYIAIPFEKYGVTGVRLALALLAGLVPLLFYRIARTLAVGQVESVWLAVAASFSLPFLAAAGQIFPDMPSGVLLLALTFLLLRVITARSQVEAPLLAVGVLASLLPWLHVKNIAPAVIFSGAALLFEARRHRLTWRQSLKILLPAGGSLALLAGYHLFAFGTLAGPFTSNLVGGATLGQAGMAILGLHLDQAQGIFLHQPLFLLSWVGLAVAYRSSPVVVVSVALVYGALLLANGVHFDTYGGLAIGGRFMWTMAALWFVPLALFCRELGARGRQVIWLCGAGSVAWQLFLMSHWVARGTGPLRLSWSANLLERNSYFPAGLRGWLPSFCDTNDWLSHPQNLWWIIVVGGFTIVGVVLSRRMIDKPQTLP